RKNGTARRAAPLVPRVLHGPEQGMAVETYLHPGGQLLAGPRPPHRAALPHRQCLGAALNARGPDISRGAQTTRPWTGPALGLGLLRRLRRPRRRLMGRRSDSGGLGFEHSGGPCPSAIRLASSSRCLRQWPGTRAPEQGPPPRRTELGLPPGEHQIKIQADIPPPPPR